MRLLNANTLTFEEYFGRDVPRYVILSHTWQDEEVSYAEMRELQEFRAMPVQFQDEYRQMKASAIESKIGYQKIASFARKVLERFLPYQSKHIWIDTCCINKDSSAELQEAINSMFRWYRDATVCFTYLADVSSGVVPSHPNSSFRRSRWFKRGWTLQELIAPKSLFFFDRRWEAIDSRELMENIIEEITEVDRRYFTKGPAIVHSASAATKMSWMAKRTTTREEDMAYCLLGIFDINMPMLYGEGARAFMRLQEEIMKYSDDSSLLAWGYPMNANPPYPGKNTHHLAPLPSLFSYCGDTFRKKFKFAHLRSPSFAVTQRGLQVCLPVFADPNNDSLAYGILECGLGRHDSGTYIAIPLFYLQNDDAGRNTSGEVARSAMARTQEIPRKVLKRAVMLDVCILRNVDIGRYYKASRMFFGAVPEAVTSLGYTLTGVYPPQFESIREQVRYLKTGRLKEKQVRIYYLSHGASGLLLIYDYEIVRQSEGETYVHINLDCPCQVYQYNGKFTLEDAMSLVSTTEARSRLQQASSVGADAKALNDPTLLRVYDEKRVKMMPAR